MNEFRNKIDEFMESFAFESPLFRLSSFEQRLVGIFDSNIVLLTIVIEVAHLFSFLGIEE